ncbi:MAG: hydroxyacid dehydrogenase [Candidatus Magasanikbacteria bacterium GW2011_GWA2_56_11]|uniref:Hydroxyacid dehydrogenase n=1 Tax=Candidatus Magasanikbacteria bacterium GW2011_GWA2_56_11 TaxID=1619044 RepID=A0A0G1YI73_9BACT|nr:MAG: hydroxyacid dehydrogenase [Candidatus Magasanikbacteria bacterium GW2011_GWA2_56_11]
MPRAAKKNQKPFALFFLSLTPDLTSYIKNQIKGLPHRIVPDVLTVDELDPKTEILGVFTDSKVTKDIFARLPRLKLVVTLSTGFDHIDLKEASRRGIPVCNVPTYGDYTVAQHALALILALSKKLFESVKRVKEGEYDYHGMRGFDLKGKTIGVVGTGHIGKQLIRLLAGFEMNIVAYDPFPDKKFAAERGFSYVPLSKLLGSADIITLHVPLLPATHHLIGKKNLKKIKPGAYIINTARGGLIDGATLLSGLQSGQIAGAGLDVLEDEEVMRDPVLIFGDKCDECTVKTSLMNSLLIDHPKTIVTPHNAFNTTEAIKRIIDTSIGNMRAFLAGNPTNNVSRR